MLADDPALDTLVVPIGGGGLISGIATAAKALKPGIEIVGVEAELYPAMHQVLRGEKPRAGGVTIAEGIAVKRPGKLTRQVVRSKVSEIRLVGEAALEAAVLLMLEIEKSVTEGAGAAGLAAVMADRARFAGKRVGIVISGGNIDSRLLSSILMRGLVPAASSRSGSRSAISPACSAASPTSSARPAATSSRSITSASSATCR